MPFMPGRSGNPGGRKPKSDEERQIEALARSYAPEALKTLALIMRSKKAPFSARSGASQALLDRGFGRTVQALKHGGDENLAPIRIESLSDAQLER
jgi:hypothetical protein